MVHAARQRLAIPLPEFSFTPMQAPALPLPQPDGRWVPVLGFATADFVEPTHQATLKQFLAAPAASFRGEPVSVSRVVHYFAHVEGGVHLGKPRDDFERHAQRAVASIESAGGSWASTLKHIAVVTVRALEPMAASIRADPIYAGHV